MQEETTMQDVFEQYAQEVGLSTDWNDLDKRYQSAKTNIAADAWNAAVQAVLVVLNEKEQLATGHTYH